MKLLGTYGTKRPRTRSLTLFSAESQGSQQMMMEDSHCWHWIKYYCAESRRWVTMWTISKCLYLQQCPWCWALAGYILTWRCYFQHSCLDAVDYKTVRDIWRQTAKNMVTHIVFGWIEPKSLVLPGGSCGSTDGDGGQPLLALGKTLLCSMRWEGDDASVNHLQMSLQKNKLWCVVSISGRWEWDLESLFYVISC